MARFICIPGFAAVALTVMAFVIVMIGPNDYEFGPKWIGPWLFVAAPSGYVLDLLDLRSISWLGPWFVQVILRVGFASLINFCVLGICGFLVWLICRLFKRAEQGAAANP